MRYQLTFATPAADLSTTTPRSIEDQSTDENEKAAQSPETTPNLPSALSQEVEQVDPHPIVGAWIEPKNLWILIRCDAILLLTKAA